MKNFKLKQALIRREAITGEKMSQTDLAKKLFKGENVKTAIYHINMACNGHRFGRFTPEKIIKACEILKCDPNYLFNFKTKNNESE